MNLRIIKQKILIIYSKFIKYFFRLITGKSEIERKVMIGDTMGFGIIDGNYNQLFIT
jgi:hypothetical protein